MRHAPLVIAATVAGLAGVLSFHTGSAKITLGATAPVARLPAQRRPPRSRPRGPAHRRAPRRPGLPWGRPSTTATGTCPSRPPCRVRSSPTSPSPRLTTGGNFRSQSIDQQSIPLLEQQALQARAPTSRSVRGKLHQRRLRAVFAVGPHQAGVQVMPVLPPAPRPRQKWKAGPISSRKFSSFMST